MYLKIHVDKRCEHQHREPERFGEWEERYSITVGEEAKLLKNRSSWGDDVPCPEGVKVGDTVYLVFAIWSSGDSFGMAHGGSSDAVGAYRTAEEAERVAAILRKGDRSGDYETRTAAEILDGNGRPYRYCKDWMGYFDSLNSIEVHPIKVIPAR